MRRALETVSFIAATVAVALSLASQPANARSGSSMSSPSLGPNAGLSSSGLGHTLNLPNYAPPQSGSLPSPAGHMHDGKSGPMPPTPPGTPTKSQSSTSTPNPNTCNPETSPACAAELTELQSESTPAVTPPLWKQPADPPAPAANTSPAAPAVVPLSPEIPDAEVSSGGALVPREPIPGGGPSLTDCMDIWEPATHMSKAEWHTTCVRTLNGIDLLPTQVAGSADKEPATKPGVTRHARLSAPSHHVHNAHAHGAAESIAY